MATILNTSRSFSELSCIAVHPDPKVLERATSPVIKTDTMALRGSLVERAETAKN